MKNQNLGKILIIAMLTLTLCIFSVTSVLAATLPIEILNTNYGAELEIFDWEGEINSTLNGYFKVNSKNPITLVVTLQGSDNVVFSLSDTWVENETESTVGISISDDSRQLSLSGLYHSDESGYFYGMDYMYGIVVAAVDGNSRPSNYPFTVIFSVDGAEMNRKVNSGIDDSIDAKVETPSSWAADQVNAAITVNLVPQSLQSKYTQATTRAEFCSLAVALYENVKGEISGRSSFTDTTDVNVLKAASIGVVSGVGDNRFDPNAQLTREQAAVMLARLADAVGKPFPKQAATFADNSAISSWAAEQVGQAQAAGIMSGVGDNKFAPKDPYTREQSIITIMRLFDVVK